MFGIYSIESTSNLSDEDLLVRSRVQPWLFRVLVDRYEQPFMRKARRIIHNPLDAEEVVQDTFTKIYLNADKFTPQAGATFSAWAYRVLLNTAFTRYQKLVKEGQRFVKLDPEFEQFIGEQANHTGFEEQRDGINRVLARLPQHLAQVLRLHYLERWSQSDIATWTGESVGTIKARIHRAKAAFRKQADGQEVDLLG